MDIVSLSETYLESSVSTDDDNLQISNYSSVRVEHPSNAKRGGVLVYCKSYLPSKLNEFKYLHECINFELRNGGRGLCKFVSLHRSPS